MDESDASERLRRLKEQVEADLQARENAVEFEFHPTDDPGVHVAVEEDVTRLYHVTFEHLPDGTDETHWSYLGTVDED